MKSCFNVPPQITCASALPGKTGKQKITFFTQMLHYSRALQRLDCVTHNAHQCAVFLKVKLSSVMCLIASTFVEIVRYPISTVHWFSLSLDEEQFPSFTQRPTPWQTWLTYSMWVTDSSILGPVWCIPLIVLTVKGGSVVIRWYINVVHVFLVKSTQHLSEKTQFSGFLFPQVAQRHKLDEVEK